MRKQALFVLAISVVVALSGCNRGPDANSTGSTGQRSINADIAATHDEGPTLENQDTSQVSIAPSFEVPFHSAH